MIKVVVTKNQVEITGHSDYANIGQDIVCSAVSSIVTTTINGIISLDSEAIYYEYYNDKMLIEIKKEDEVTRKLIVNMIDLLKTLSKDYPKNIKVKEMV